MENPDPYHSPSFKHFQFKKPGSETGNCGLIRPWGSLLIAEPHKNPASIKEAGLRGN
jgi:hypothetical protein